MFSKKSIKKREKHFFAFLFILLLTLTINIKVNALEEGEWYLFKDFKHNGITIKGFIVNTNLQYNKQYCSESEKNIYSYWIPNIENKEKTYFIHWDKTNNTYTLYIEGLTNKYWSYGPLIDRNYPQRKWIIRETGTNTAGTKIYTHYIKNLETGNETAVSVIPTTIYRFDYNIDNEEWIINTTNMDANGRLFYKKNQTSNIQKWITWNGGDYSNQIIKTSIELYDINNNLLNEDYDKMEEEYYIEDTTQEKEEINYNDFIIDINMQNIMKNFFINITKKEKLYKIILATFTFTMILLIKKKV